MIIFQFSILMFILPHLQWLSLQPDGYVLKWCNIRKRKPFPGQLRYVENVLELKKQYKCHNATLQKDQKKSIMRNLWKQICSGNLPEISEHFEPFRGGSECVLVYTYDKLNSIALYSLLSIQGNQIYQTALTKDAVINLQ